MNLNQRSASGSKKPKKQSNLEAEIEKARINKDWDNALKLVSQYSKLQEGTLDPLLEPVVYSEHYIETGRVSDAKLLLAKALDKNPDDEESIALMGKAELETGNPEEALKYLRKLNNHKTVKSVSNSYSLHQARLLLEVLYRRGYVCYESNHKNKEAIESYKELLDFAVKYFHGGASIDRDCQAWIEKTLNRLPSVYWKAEDMPNCIDALRYCLSTPFEVKMDPFRRLLASILVRKCSSQEYPKTQKEESNNVYIPRDEVEESVLLMLILDDGNQQMSNEELIMYDDLTLSYAKRNGYNHLSRVLERVISTRFNNLHFWYQFGLSLISAKKYRRALFVLKHCIAMESGNPVYYLLAAKICINYLQVSQGLQFAQRALEIVTKGEEGSSINQSYLPSIHHFIGLAYSKLSHEAHSNEDKKALQLKAIDALKVALDYDDQDFLVNFHLALLYAEIREIPKAVHFVSRSLQLNRGHPDSYNLSALLLSSQKQYSQALQMCKLGLQECTDINLIITKAKLEQHLDRVNDSLLTYKEALILWKKQQAQQVSLEEADGTVDNTDHKSVESSVKDFEVDSFDKRSFVYTHTVSVYSDNIADKYEEHQTVQGRVDIWLNASELFCILKQYQDAVNCLQEARAIVNISADIFYLEGFIEESRNKDKEAMTAYEKALSVDSNHTNTLIRLGILYHKKQQFSQAEKCLTSVVRRDYTNHDAWYHLGQVYTSLGVLEKATECFLTATQLEQTAPVINFSKIKKQLL